MPRKRYSDIVRAADLQRQLSAKAVWEQNRFANTQANVGSGTAKSPNIYIQIIAFGADSVADDFIVRANQRNNTAIGSFLGTRFTTTLSSSGQRNRNFVPAITKVFAATGTSVVQTSAITGNRYLKQGGERYQHAFGGLTSTEKEFEAANAILSAVIATNPTWRVGFTPERMYRY